LKPVNAKDKIDNSVANVNGNLYLLKVSSSVYDIDNINIYLKEEKDPYIFEAESSTIFVVLNKRRSKGVAKASGSIENNRFTGSLTIGGKVFFIEETSEILTLEEALEEESDDVSVVERHKWLEANEDPAAPQAISLRPKSRGNVCTMRIIVDKHLMKVFNNDKNRLRVTIKQHEEELNEIYQSIKIRGKPFRFKVTDVIFKDDTYCGSHSDNVACTNWGKTDDDEFLEEHARTNHSDTCLTFIWTSHDFGATLGVAYIGTVCNDFKRTITSNGAIEYLSANTGFITFKGKSKVLTSYLTFAHEVGHNMGAGHDGQGQSSGCPSRGYLMAAYAPNKPTDQNHQFSECSRTAIENAVRVLEQDDNRQCLVHPDKIQVSRPNPRPKPETTTKARGNSWPFPGWDYVTTTKRITITRIDTRNPVEDGMGDTAIIILSVLVAVLFIFLVLLLFCLCSKRDLSPCPKNSNFGRRFTEVRRSVRVSTYHLRRSMTTGGIFRTQGSPKSLDDEDDLDDNRKSEEPLMPGSKRNISNVPSSPIVKPKPYVTPSAHMIPKTKPHFQKAPFGGSQDSKPPLVKKLSNSPTLRPAPTIPGSPWKKAAAPAPAPAPTHAPAPANRFVSTQQKVQPFKASSNSAFQKPQVNSWLTQKSFNSRVEVKAIGRDESENSLASEIMGGFLVRRSKGKLVLSVKSFDGIKHIQLIEKNGQITGDQVEWFPSTDALVQYYKENTIPGYPNLRLR